MEGVLVAAGTEPPQPPGAGWPRLVRAVRDLASARELADVVEIVRHAARELVAADGATFVLRDNGYCFYVDEDAIGPLWRGQRFPMEACISGWAMMHAEAVHIADIYLDGRIPHDAYRPTFVRSLIMTPVRTAEPIAAIGTYWADEHRTSDDERELLQALADSTAVALESVRVLSELEERVERRTAELADAHGRYRALARSLPGAFVLLFDHDLRFLIAEGQGLADFGLCSEEMEGRLMPEVLRTRARVLVPRYVAALGGETVRWERAVDGRAYELTAAPVRDERGGIEAGMVVGVDVTPTKRWALIQGIVGRLAMSTANRTPLPTIIGDAIDAMLDLFDAGYARLVAFEPGGMRVIAAVPALGDPPGAIVDPGQRSATARVLATGRPAVLALDASASGTVKQYYDVGVRTAISVPVTVGGDLWGALGLGLRSDPSHPDEIVRLLSDIAGLLAVAIGSAASWEGLEHLALHDPLTGLPNRRAFEQRLAAELGRSERTGRDLAVAVVDLDGFKAVNDTYGHPVGDEVLRDAATCLSASLRAHEFAARLGGEEFGIVITDTSASGAFEACERLRRSLASLQHDRGIRMTGSFGLATLGGTGLPGEAPGPAQLIELADEALYEAKRSGRNRVVARHAGLHEAARQA